MLEHIQLCNKINNSVSLDVLSTNDRNASCRGLPAQHAGFGFANSPHDVGAQDQACSYYAGACQHWDGNSHHQALSPRTSMVSGVGAPRARTALPANLKDTVSAATFTSTINCTRCCSRVCLLEVQFAGLTLNPHCSVVCIWHVSGVWAVSVTQTKETAAASMVLQDTGSIIVRTKAASCNKQSREVCCHACQVLSPE